MARYRKIDVRLWLDGRVKALSPLAPSGQALWVYLLTNPNTTNIPGLYRSGEAAMAEELRWPLEAFQEAFAEVSGQRMAKADWEDRVVWIPKAIEYNRPESPNVVRGWRVTWDEIPEGELKAEAQQYLRAFLEGMGEAFAEAFEHVYSKAPSKTCLNQEQEQEQEQEEKPVGAAKPEQPHQTLINKFLDLKGVDRSNKGLVASWYRRHARSALALIKEAGGLDNALAALEWGAEKFDKKGLTWTLDTIAKHLPDFARCGHDAALARTYRLRPDQVAYARKLAAWLQPAAQPNGHGAVPGGAQASLPHHGAGPRVRVADAVGSRGRSAVRSDARPGPDAGGRLPGHELGGAAADHGDAAGRAVGQGEGVGAESAG